MQENELFDNKLNAFLQTQTGKKMFNEDKEEKEKEIEIENEEEKEKTDETETNNEETEKKEDNADEDEKDEKTDSENRKNAKNSISKIESQNSQEILKLKSLLKSKEEQELQSRRAYNSVSGYVNNLPYGLTAKEVYTRALNAMGINTTGNETLEVLNAKFELVKELRGRVDNSFEYASDNGSDGFRDFEINF